MTCRILVVDDSTPIQKVIKIAFSKYQASILAAGSLAEAIKECEKSKPDLIIADASIPGVSSAQDFSRLLAKSHGGAMVMLMGSYDAVRESDLRAAGFETIVKKPFDAVELLSACEALIPGKLQPAGGAPSPMSGSVATPAVAPTSLPSFSLGATDFASQNPTKSGAGSASAGLTPNLAQTQRDEVPAFLIDPNPDLNVQIPPLPKLELGQKGRRAFEGGGEQSLGAPPPIKSQVQPQHAPSFQIPEASLSQQPMSGLPGDVSKVLPALVEKAVVKYCEAHFKETARDVLTAELRRLADEKAKYLVDT